MGSAALVVPHAPKQRWPERGSRRGALLLVLLACRMCGLLDDHSPPAAVSYMWSPERIRFANGRRCGTSPCLVEWCRQLSCIRAMITGPAAAPACPFKVQLQRLGRPCMKLSAQYLLRALRNHELHDVVVDIHHTHVKGWTWTYGQHHIRCPMASGRLPSRAAVQA